MDPFLCCLLLLGSPSPHSLVTLHLTIFRLIHGKSLEKWLCLQRQKGKEQDLGRKVGRRINPVEGTQKQSKCWTQTWMMEPFENISRRQEFGESIALEVNVNWATFWDSTLAVLSHSTASGLSHRIPRFVIQPQASLMVKSLITLIRSKYIYYIQNG